MQDENGNCGSEWKAGLDSHKGMSNDDRFARWRAHVGIVGSGAVRPYEFARVCLRRVVTVGSALR